MKKKTLLHLLWAGHTGGIEKFCFDISKNSTGLSVEHVFCFLSEKGKFGKSIQKNGSKVLELKMKSGMFFWKLFSFLKIIRETNPDAILSHTRNYLANCMLLFFQKPKFYFVHGNTFLKKKIKKALFFYKFFGHQYSAFLVNSKHIREQIKTLRSLKNKDIKVCSLGVDTNVFVPIDNCPMVPYQVGCVCRLAEQKNVFDFISIANILSKKFGSENFVFTIVGDGPLRKELELYAKMKNVKIDFRGERDDIENILKEFDVFLITSNWEPFGITVLEALSSGVPVFGFDVPGMREIGQAGGGMFLIKERDCELLARKIQEVLYSKTKYQDMKERGVKNIDENFTIKKSVSTLENLIFNR